MEQANKTGTLVLTERQWIDWHQIEGRFAPAQALRPL
jgi:hypothetical protein